MKNNKSPGPGGIPVELFKYSADVVLENLMLLFNECLKEKEILFEWNPAHIREGNKHKCTNYKGLVL